MSPGRDNPESEDLSRLLLRLDADVAAAWEQYAILRRRITKIFQWNNCFPADDFAAEALERVGKKLESEEIHDVTGYCVGVARMMCKEVGRRKQRENSLEGLVGGPDSVPDSSHLESQIIANIDQKMWLVFLRECLAKLKPDERVFILAFYGAEGEKDMYHRRRLAEETNLKGGALRTRANRLRDKLEDCIMRSLRNRREIAPISN